MKSKKESQAVITPGNALRVELTARHLPEPHLIFGNEQTTADPKLGLALYGPVSLRPGEPPSPGEIRVGIIGTGETIELAKGWLTKLDTEVAGKQERNYLFPPFPGFNKTFNCKLRVSTDLDYVLTSQD